MITGKIVDGILELTGQQGTTWEFEIEVYEDEANTIPFPLDGYLARGQYRKDRTADAKLLMTFDCTIPDFDAVNNPNHNKVLVVCPASRSSDLNNTELRINNSPVFRGVFDIEVYKVVSTVEVDVKRPLEGTLVITPEVTRT